MQRLAKLLNHPLAVRSRAGSGSCFELRVAGCPPPQDKEVHPTLPPSPGTSGALPTCHILLVEENAMVRDALQAMFAGWGMRVTAEDNAAAAITRMGQETFDAVLSDWRLPGEIDGLIVLRHARDQRRARFTALLTGDNLQEVPDGFTVISKPVRPLRLRALLGTHLGDTPPSTA